MVRHIIVPLDGSPLSHAALPLARGMAARTGAAVSLMTVLDPPSDFFYVPQDSTQSRVRPRDIERLSSENARQEDYLNQIASSFKDLPVGTSVHVGNPADQILEVAESSTDAIIVMASHGRTGLGRALLGSVAARVVQGAQIPVFIVRASKDSKDEYGTATIEHVVVPLDGSLIAEQALAAVRRLFGNSVRLYLVRLVEPIAPGQAYAPQTVVEYERNARDVAEHYLRGIAERLTDEGTTVAWEVRGGVPGQGISDAAREVNADLIAMTTHGRTGLGRFALGSVTERVLHDANIPVMVVRATQLESEDSDAPPLV